MKGLPYSTTFIEAVDKKIDNFLSFISISSNIPNFHDKIMQEIDDGWDAFSLTPLDALAEYILEMVDVEPKEVRMVVSFQGRNRAEKTYYTWNGACFVGSFLATT